jgi:hypothetical protein
MSTKVRTVLALLMVIMVLAGCGGVNVEAARAAVPRVPAPHVPPRPPHIPRWERYKPLEPRVGRVPVVPHDGPLSFEALVELRVRDLRERYEQEVIPYACKAKDIWDMSQAESIEDAAEQVVLSVGGNVTLVPSVVRLVHEMERKSATDRVGEVAVFTLCQAVG